MLLIFILLNGEYNERMRIRLSQIRRKPQEETTHLVAAVESEAPPAAIEPLPQR
jgi:hypothetical protein